MSASLTWHEEPIARHHDRSGFDCGNPELNLYLAKFARQNHEAGGAKTFVAIGPPGDATILGFYSICPGAIQFGRVPTKPTRKPGHYDVPVFRLGRLAVDRASQGRGLGASYWVPPAFALWLSPWRLEALPVRLMPRIKELANGICASGRFRCWTIRRS